jgi:hypothetical protein
MALQLSIPTKFGINAEYWKITTLNVDYLSNNVEVTLAGWVTSQERLNGKKPLEIKGFQWNEPAFPFNESEPVNERMVAYQLIKSDYADDQGVVHHSQFAEAIDC